MKRILFLLGSFLFSVSLLAASPVITLTLSNFQINGTNWSYTLTGAAFDGTGNPLTPQQDWEWHWYFQGNEFAVTYGSNTSATLQRAIGQQGNVQVQLRAGWEWDEFSEEHPVGHASVSFDEISYSAGGQEWQITFEVSGFYIDGTSVSCGQTYDWWVKRYIDGVADPAYFYQYSTNSDEITIDGNFVKNCWIWQIYVLAQIPNNNSIQATPTIWVPYDFDHFPCFGNPARKSPHPEPTITTIPDQFALHQNFPNPFNPETEISFVLPEQSLVRITVSDALGREILTLADKEYGVGYHHVTWKGVDRSGNKVASGVYFYRMIVVGEKGSQFTKVMKMLITK